MRNRLLTLVILLSLMGLSTTAFAADKAGLLAQAAKAQGDGKLDEAAKAYCDASALDSKDADLAATCKSTQKDVSKQLERFDQYLSDGISLAGQGKFDEANAQFKRIKYGPNKATAADWMTNKIPQMQSQAQAAKQQQAQAEQVKQAQEAKDNQFLNDARTALNAKDWGRAKQLANQVSSAHSGDAQNIINQASSGEQAAAAALAAANKPPINNPPPTNTGQAQPPKPVVIDTAKRDHLIEDGAKFEAKGDTKRARDAFAKALEVDSTSVPAKEGVQRNRLLEDDPKLAKLLDGALKKFYSGDFAEAETQLGSYVDIGGARAGLGNFYLGAARLTRYYLEGNEQAQKSAIDAFKAAKKVRGFTPPDKSVMSPKILKAYEQAGM
jgi:hypothetical protein